MEKCSMAHKNYAFYQPKQQKEKLSLPSCGLECHRGLGETLRAGSTHRIFIPLMSTSRTSGFYLCSCASWVHSSQTAQAPGNKTVTAHTRGLGSAVVSSTD